LFVRPDQLLDEFIGVVDLMKTVLDRLGLKDFRARLGTKDPASDKYIGHDDNWTAATAAIEQACQKMGMEYFVSPGDAAFYGPKLDLIIKDALGRDWQMGTVQVDYNLPERFELEYIGEDSKPHRPIMIHRAPFGSLERMIGLLTEQYAGAFPFWLSPVQVAVLPISDRHVEAAAHLLAKLRDTHKLRVHLDDRRETLGKKIRENQLQKVPFMLILGDRDIEQGTVGVRSREDGDLGAMALEAFIDKVATLR
jgi:threonyl-tRNA synthetase